MHKIYAVTTQNDLVDTFGFPKCVYFELLSSAIQFASNLQNGMMKITEIDVFDSLFEFEEKQQNRKQDLKAKALAKLTHEERQVLGL